MASTYLSRTYGTPTNNLKYTKSFWIKRSGLSNIEKGFVFSNSTNSNTDYFYFNASDQIQVGNVITPNTTAVFRDVSAWYHCVMVFDSANATADDRLILYVNGIRQTLSTTISLNSTGGNQSGVTYEIGHQGGQSRYLDGCLAHVVLIDGQALTPSSFGQTDATTGIWKPKTNLSSLTFGNNGYWLKFENSGSMGTDSSGNGNNFTVNGNLTQTVDTPSNVFATMNPLDNYYANSTFSNGNLRVVTNSSNYTWNTATMGVSQGKWYWEVKYVSTTSENYNLIGITERPSTSSTGDVLGLYTYSYAYYSDSGNRYANGNSSAYGNSYTAGDIIGVALDLDNNKLYFSKNGTWQNSGVPTSGATGTGAISITAPSSTTFGLYFPAFGDYGASMSVTNDINFGNGYFGTTAVSSAQSPSDGIGIFEYAVPSGYKALCTKSINAQEYS